MIFFKKIAMYIKLGIHTFRYIYNHPPFSIILCPRVNPTTSSKWIFDGFYVIDFNVRESMPNCWCYTFLCSWNPILVAIVYSSNHVIHHLFDQGRSNVGSLECYLWFLGHEAHFILGNLFNALISVWWDYVEANVHVPNVLLKLVWFCRSALHPLLSLLYFRKERNTLYVLQM